MTTSTIIKTLSLIGSAGLALGLSNIAVAQTADTVADDSLDEIVVTATKKARAEELQRVPIAITAFGQRQIENMFATNISDIAQLAPNVRLQPVGSVPGVANFTIRGMGINTSVVSDEPTVGVVLDGVYLASNYGALVDTFDLESLEILRGPQGTLFGRNVTAGVVNIRTRRPSGDHAFDARMKVGSGGRKEISAAIDTPITSSLSARLSASYRALDGFYTNRVTGKRIDSVSDWDFRPSLKWQPDASTTMYLMGQLSRYRDGGPTLRLDRTPGYGLQARGYVPPPRGSLLIDNNFDPHAFVDIEGLTLEANRDIGNGVLTSISGYRRVRFDLLLDIDGTAVDFFRTFSKLDQKQFSEELRYAGTALDGRLDYTVGVYGFAQTLQSGTLYRVIPAAPTSSLVAEGTIKEQSISGFTQLEFRPVSQVSLIAGMRLNYDRKSARIGNGVAPVGSCNPVVFPVIECSIRFSDAKSWTDFSPKAGVTWSPTNNTLIFASFTRGFRSGGYNLRTFSVAASPGPYDAEKVTSYEGGIKQQFLDGRARLNLTGYYNKYDNLQRTVLAGNATQTILNAAKANIYGLELEGSARLFRGFRIDGSLGYTHASYSAFTGLDLNGDGVPDPIQAKDLQLERAPKWTYSISTNYDLVTASSGTFAASATYSYTARMAGNTANTFFVPSYYLLDASVRWTTPDKHMTVAIYGSNLTDEVYGVTGLDVSSVGRGLYYNSPRSYGVELRFHF